MIQKVADRTQKSVELPRYYPYGRHPHALYVDNKQQPTPLFLFQALSLFKDRNKD